MLRILQDSRQRLLQNMAKAAFWRGYFSKKVRTAVVKMGGKVLIQQNIGKEHV